MDEDEGALAAPHAQPRPAASEERPPGNLWAVVLAGGDGRRLEALTRSPNGVPVPKQFCRFRDDRSLLHATIDRVRRIVDHKRIVVVVMERHRPWWEGELADLPSENVLAQPENRGTAIAVLHALMHIRMHDPSPQLLVMPADHDIEDEDVLLRKVRRAVKTAAVFEDEIVLLGIVPTHIDVEYGLVVPAPGQLGTSRKVMTFVEKPTLSAAAQLMRHGAMWNSFIFACTGRALYGLYDEAVPALVRIYLKGLAAAAGDPNALSMLFRNLPTRDFSRDLLQREARRLRLVSVPACGWTDLGTPARLAAWLDRHREAAFWLDRRLPLAAGAVGPPGVWHARTAQSSA